MKSYLSIPRNQIIISINIRKPYNRKICWFRYNRKYKINSKLNKLGYSKNKSNAFKYDFIITNRFI